MTNVYFRYGKVDFVEGPGQVHIGPYGNDVSFDDDTFFLFGDASGMKYIDVFSASLNSQNIKTHERLFFSLHNSKAESINANKIFLFNSSISNASANQLKVASGNSIINGTVSAKVVNFDNNATLNVAKDAVFKVPNKNALDFSKISGEGKIYIESEHAYYSTDGHAINNANLLGASIKEHNFAVAKATEKVKDKMDIYIDGHEHQKYDVDLLNIEAGNNDNLI